MARKKAEKVETKVEPKKAKPVVKVEKTIPELLDELHARFTAKLGESYRARDCARKVNKIKRLVGADEVLKG
jgi:hypothetical protein